MKWNTVFLIEILPPSLEPSSLEWLFVDETERQDEARMEADIPRASIELSLFPNLNSLTCKNQCGLGTLL